MKLVSYRSWSVHGANRAVTPLVSKPVKVEKVDSTRLADCETENVMQRIAARLHLAQKDYIAMDSIHMALDVGSGTRQ